MNIDSIYPGRLLKDVTVDGMTEYGGYNLTWHDKKNNSIKLHLKEKYMDKDMELSEGKKLSGPVVVLDSKSNSFHNVALKNYYSKLNELVYPDGDNTSVKNIPWKEFWKMAFNSEFDPIYQLKEFKEEFKEEWAVKFPEAVIPVKSNKYLRNMKYESNFFPDKLTRSRKNFAVYKPQLKKNKLPKVYSCKIEYLYKKKTYQKDTTLFFHGFLDPLKYHFNIWKHLVADPEITEPEYTNSRYIWNACADMGIKEENIKDFIECKAKWEFKNGRKTCSVCNKKKCPPYRFEKINKKYMNHGEKYVNYAIDFLKNYKKSEENNVKMRSNFEEFEIKFNKKIKCNGYNPIITLPLVGFCYNFQEDNPLIHLLITTFYMKTSNNSIISNGDQNITFGKIIKLNEVK